MAHKAEFLPTTRQGRLDMGTVWLHVLLEEANTETGELVPRWKLWGIPEEIFREYGRTVTVADKALNEAKDAENRTDVIDARVKTSFKALVFSMRSLKKRFFHIPPLTEEGFAALLLKVPETTHTVSGDPTAQVTIETFLVGRHQLGLRFVYVSGDPGDRANKGYLVYYKVVAHGEKVPESPAELTLSFPERRRTRVQDFDFADSGKTVYYCVRITNGRKMGPWGPMVSALIP